MRIPNDLSTTERTPLVDPWFPIFSLLTILVTVVVVLGVYSYSTSPWMEIGLFDSEIFKILGNGILQGKVPYRDLFDHKGPLLFFLEALGLGLAPGRLGLFALQVVSLSVFCWVSMLTARLFTSNRKALLASILTLLASLRFLQEGNQCEEWELVWIALSLFCGLKAILALMGERRGSILVHSLVIGVCLGVISSIRLNDVVIPVGVAGGIVGLLISQRRWSQLAPLLLCGLTGVVIVWVPQVLYFVANGALSDMIFGAFTSNFQYARVIEVENPARGYLLRLLFVGGPLILLGLLSWLRKDPWGRRTLWILLPAATLSFFSFGVANFEHYFLAAVPLFAVLMALVLDRRWKPTALWLLVFLVPLVGADGFRAVQGLRTFLQGTQNMDRARAVAFYQRMDSILDHIPGSERADIWNYNLVHKDIAFFSHYRLSPANRFFVASHRLLIPAARNSNDLSLLEKPPQWLMVAGEPNDPSNEVFVQEHYRRIDTLPGMNDSTLSLWKWVPPQ